MRGAKWLAFGGLVASFGLAFACSSSSPAPPYPDVASFCTGLAAAECQVITDACGNQPSVSSCQSSEALACQNAANAATAAGRTYSTGDAKTCIDLATKTYAGTVSNPRISAADLATLQTTCDEVFQGAIPSGGACATDLACANDNVCTFFPGQAQGTCGPATPVALGGFCDNPGDQCTNSYCGGASSPYKCVALLPTGSSCTVNAECVGHCVAGLCQPLGTVGSPCTTSQDCDPSQNAGFCDPARDNTCQNGETFDVGEPECTDFGFGATPSGTGSSSSSSSSGGSSSGSSSSGSSSGTGSSSGGEDGGGLDSGAD